MAKIKERARGLAARQARRWLFPAVEGAWTTAFALAGLLVRPRARVYQPGGLERVLVVAPHPDDEALGCGGTIGLHRMAGNIVCVLVVTDGGSSRAGGLSRDEMRAVRARELKSAMSRLPGCELLHLGLPEGSWSPQELVRPLRDVLEDLRPSVVYTASCVDFHPEHLKVAEGVAQALALYHGRTTDSLKVRAYELQVPLTPVLANVISTVTPAFKAKHRALGEYRSQAGSFAWVPRAARYLRRLYRVGGAIEVFWEMSPEQFCALMSRYREVSPRFRSIRMRPLSDPLAWLVGLNTRIRLKQLVSSEEGLGIRD